MTTYPPEVYAYLERVRNNDRTGWETNPTEEERLQRVSLEEGLTECYYALHHALEAGENITEAEYYGSQAERVSAKGELALRRYMQKPAHTKREQGATVNQKMMEMVHKDPSLIELTAKQWAEKLGCTDAAVKQTATWKITIKKGRELERYAQIERNNGRHR